MQVLNIEPHNPLALAYVGMVYQMTGRFGDAIQKYHEVCFQGSTLLLSIAEIHV
jgi:cytochrome c-type biogenesis protein CcmH/NrfG